jgi:hypothetical protein
VLSGEHSAHVCTRLSSSAEGPRAGYRRRVLERWGHSSVQCNSSCKAPGVWHQGHALHDDLGTLGVT